MESSVASMVVPMAYSIDAEALLIGKEEGTLADPDQLNLLANVSAV